MSNTRIFRMCVGGIAIVAALTAPTRADVSPRLDADVYRQLDADVAAALVIPNLRTLNGDLEAMLESMERQDLLFAGRPLDQVKAFLGVSSHLDDFRGAAVAWGPASAGDGPDDVNDKPTDEGLGPAVFIAPTKNPVAFVEANFTPMPDVGPRAVRARNGTILHYVIDETGEAPFVRFCTDAARLDAYAPAADVWRTWRETLPEDAATIATQSEVVIIGRDPARLAATLDTTLLSDLPPVVRTVVRRLGEREEAGLIGVDFDALALVVRGVGVFSKTWLAAAPRTPGRELRMDRLSDDAFYAAASADVSRFDQSPAFREAFTWLGIGGPPAWASSVQGVQAASYVPPRAPGRAGLLSRSVVRFRTADPAAVERVMRDPEQPRRYTLSDLPRELQPYGPLLALALGAGEVTLQAQRTQPDEVSLTLRPDSPVAAGPTGGTLADHPMLRAMRAWLPSPRDAEAFISAGPVLAWVRAIADRAPMLPADLVIPEVELRAPALAFAARIDAGEVIWTVIAPSDVLEAVVNALIARR